MLLSHVFMRLRGGGDLFGRFDLIDATSMTPTSTSLPLSSESRLMGTFELMHSTETWLIGSPQCGKIFSIGALAAASPSSRCWP